VSPWAGIAYWVLRNSLRAGRSGGRIPFGGEIFSAPIQTGPGAHPASCTIGTEPGRGVDHPPLFSTVVKESVELYMLQDKLYLKTRIEKM